MMRAFFVFFKGIAIVFQISLGKNFQTKKNKPSRIEFKKPFWRYGILAAIFLMLSFAIGGSFGVLLFLRKHLLPYCIWKWHHIEHYGLTRKLMSNGKYEPTNLIIAGMPITRQATSLINLQLHSDHHAKPDREYPLLQKYDKDQAPQLPFGYPLMIAICLIPVLWRKALIRGLINGENIFTQSLNKYIKYA